MHKFACLVFFIATAAAAQRPDGPPPERMQDRNSETCSAATLHGDYIFAQDGFAGGKPVAESGRESYDGNGHVKGISTISTNGVITRGAYTATYTIKADCTGTLTITDSDRKVFHYDFYTVPSGDELAWVQTDKGSVSAGWERRRPNRPPPPR